MTHIYYYWFTRLFTSESRLIWCYNTIFLTLQYELSWSFSKNSNIFSPAAAGGTVFMERNFSARLVFCTFGADIIVVDFQLSGKWFKQIKLSKIENWSHCLCIFPKINLFLIIRNWWNAVHENIHTVHMYPKKSGIDALCEIKKV